MIQADAPEFKGQLHATAGPKIFLLEKWDFHGGENPTEQLSSTTLSNMKNK